MARPHPTTLTARSPEDLLALAPFLLGFWPEESIVMLTFGADRPFHARIDLPPLPDQTTATLRAVEESLLAPAREHHAQRVVLLYYSADPAAAAGMHRALRRACRRARIQLALAYHADGACYTDLTHPDPAVRERPRPYDVSCHPIVVQGIVEGRIAHRTRADMVASLEADPDAADAVAAALAAGRHADGGIPVDGWSIREEGRWVEALVGRLLVGHETPTDDDLAHLVWVMQAKRVRDAAWSLIHRSDAEDHVRLWRGVVRRTPDQLVAPPAALLGWSAWQAGDGALAWAAVDRCLRAEPDYTLATYLSRLLEDATPPERWEGGFDWAVGLPA